MDNQTLSNMFVLALPVLEENGKMAGIITVDDVIDMLIPDRGSLDTFARLFLSKRTMH